MHASTLDQVWDDMCVFLDSQMYSWDHTCMFEIHKWKGRLSFGKIRTCFGEFRTNFIMIAMTSSKLHTVISH